MDQYGPRSGFLVFASTISTLSNAADIKKRQHFQGKSLVTSNGLYPHIEELIKCNKFANISKMLTVYLAVCFVCLI